MIYPHENGKSAVDRHRGAIELIAGQLDCALDDIPMSADVTELPNMDSLKLLTSLSLLERYYGVELDTEDLPDVCTVGELCARFDAQRAGSGMPRELEQP